MLGSRSLITFRPAWLRHWPAALSAAVVVVAVGLVLLRPSGSAVFPGEWNLGLRQPIDQFQAWVIGHRNTHPIFLYFFDPLSDGIDFGLRRVEALLLALPWTVVVGGSGLLGYWLGGWRLAAWAMGGLLYVGVVGLWLESMQTLALMAVSVALALLIGIPLGIWAARNPALDGVLRPLLDGMQTMPAFVYLIPVLLFFGVARVPSVVATVIYALPPAIRLTSLGLRQVSPSAIEAARAFGSTPRQMLLKVQLPLALPSIMAGVSQTIMMALGIVVIAALIGAGGLGNVVLKSLQRLQVGRAVEAGQAIVFLAIILDRMGEGLSRLDLARLSSAPSTGERRRVRSAASAHPFRRLTGRMAAWAEAGAARHPYLITSLLILLGLWLAAAVTGAAAGFPPGWRVPLAGPIDVAVAWMRDNLYQLGGLPAGTGPLSDFITLQILNPLRQLFVSWLPWPAVVLGGALIGLTAGGWRLFAVAGAGLFAVGLLGMWEAGMDTLSQVLAAVAFTAALALPLGILAARYDRFQAVLRPVLDTLQTIPSFVFLVPVIMLFHVGRVPGLIAAVLYALPPGIKLIDLGLRQVEPATVEAARSFGSTYRQTLAKVLLPLALPSILLGINQIIMMVLAMVVISGLVGGAGLGLEAVTGLARNETGRGLEAGLAIVLLAIVLDRITQTWASRRQ